MKAVFEPIEYSVTASVGEGGAVTPDKSTATIGDEIRVTVTPDAGYEIASVSANGGDVALTPGTDETGVYTFTMPADNVVLTASFTKVPHSVTTSAELGTLTADKATATVGETVTLTALPVSEHQHLGALTVLCGDGIVETTKESDTTYTFTMPAGDVTASANFVRNFYVYFVNWNGVTLQWGDLPLGATPEYTGETPVREQNEMYSFTFAGWDKQIGQINEDTVYTATYTWTPRTYEINFVGANDAVLQSDTLAYGETPEYTGATPTKETDDDYVYTFAGWDKQISAVTGDTTYTATFSTVPVLHDGITFLTLESYAAQNNPFTPEESGYYRFLSAGDEMREQVSLTDEAGDAVNLAASGYYPERDYHFEFVAWLEAGETYTLTTNSYSRAGMLAVTVSKVDMYTVHCENAPHGTVGDLDEPTFMAYNGQKIYPYATPDEGYGLVELTVTDSNGKRLLAEADGGYYMPASDVTVTATFEEAYAIDCDTTENAVSYFTNPAVFDDWTSGDLEQRAAAGVSVEFRFNWDAGYILDEFRITTASGENVECGSFRPYLNNYEVWFTMPDEPITVTVNVVRAYDLTFDPGVTGGTAYKSAVRSGAQITLPACPFDAPAGKAFASWSVAVGDGAAAVMAPGENFTVTANATATAIYADITYGDADASGGVDLDDAIVLLQYLANFDDATGTSSVEVGAGADADASGGIELDDAILLIQYLANYDDATGTSSVVLGPQS